MKKAKGATRRWRHVNLFRSCHHHHHHHHHHLQNPHHRHDYHRYRHHQGYVSARKFTFWPTDSDNYWIQQQRSYFSGPPEPPSDVQVRLNCDRVDLSWAAPLSNRGGTVTAYRVELLQGGRPVDSESFDTDTTSHTFGSLERSAGYVVRLNARNSMGSGSWRTIAFNTTELCKSSHLTPPRNA